MSFVCIGNIIEGIFFLGASLFFVIPALRRSEPNRLFCVYGAAVFLSSAGSDFFEAYTGAWWEPRWLILWNASVFLGVAGICLWYIRICGSLEAVLQEFGKPLGYYFQRKAE